MARGRGRNVFGARRRRGPWKALGALLLTLALAAGVYAAVDNGRAVIRTQRVLVSDLPKALEGYTVLLISDLAGARFGPAQSQIKKALSERSYSAVCLLGDMVGERGDPLPLYELLSALDGGKPVFFIAGDADPAPVVDGRAQAYSVLADWVNGLATRGATYLDAPASVSVGSATVWFSDASQLSLDLETAESAYAASDTASSAYRLSAVRETIAAREAMKQEDLHVVLSHRPLSGDTLRTYATVGGEGSGALLRTVDLLVSGGTCGGQWRLPLLGPVYDEGWFPAEEAVGGYRYLGGALQYTTGGLSVSASSPLPGFRLFNAPEMTLITFTSQMDLDVLP